jgi:hypothetical protein
VASWEDSLVKGKSINEEIAAEMKAFEKSQE